MAQFEERPPGPDDTAAFQRFYGADGGGEVRRRGLFYRLFVAWWRDRT